METCRDFERGVCTRGSACRYLHSTEQKGMYGRHSGNDRGTQPHSYGGQHHPSYGGHQTPGYGGHQPPGYGYPPPPQYSSPGPQYGGGYGAPYGGGGAYGGYPPSPQYSSYGSPYNSRGGYGSGFPANSYDQQSSYPPKSTTETCGDWLRARCTRGSQCRYLHEKTRETCGDWIRGRCTRGTSCKYLHEKEVCMDFQRGSCTRGDECRYKHESRDELPRHAPPPARHIRHPPRHVGSMPRGVPDMLPTRGYISRSGFGAYGGGAPRISAPIPRHGSREVCGDWLRGRCARERSCKFAHEKSMQSCSDFLHGRCERGGACKYLHKKDVCSDWTKGVCRRGTECKFLHDKTEDCKDFQRGSCLRPACRFRHDMPDGAPGPRDPANSVAAQTAPAVAPAVAHVTPDKTPVYASQHDPSTVVEVGTPNGNLRKKRQRSEEGVEVGEVPSAKRQETNRNKPGDSPKPAALPALCQ